MVFFDDRVELLGVKICGDKTETGRQIFDLLRKKKNDETFVAYSGNQLSKSLGVKSAGAAVRDLRDRIADALLTEANVKCERADVILSRDPGYRLSEKLSVQDGDAAGETQSHGHGMPQSDGDGPVNGGYGTVDVTDGDTVKGTDDTAETRRKWILKQIDAGRRLRAPHIADELKCSPRTVRRDLDDLSGQIEFMGPPRTGYYRRRQTPESEKLSR